MSTGNENTNIAIADTHTPLHTYALERREITHTEEEVAECQGENHFLSTMEVVARSRVRGAGKHPWIQKKSHFGNS